MRGIAGIGAAAAGLLMALVFAQSAAAATCSDYDNQAAAQRAADTKDADGDGIYCEALPCPCLKPGESDTPKQPSTPRKPSKPKRPATKPKKTPRVLRSRAQIVAVVAPGTVDVQTSRAGRSPGLHTRERVRLIGLTAPAAGRCGYQEALAQTLTLAFGDAARDTDGDGLADREPQRPREFGALVDIRTDTKIKPRDGQRRLRAYLDAGHTGVDLGRELVAAGWAEAGYGEYARSQRMLKAQERAQRIGAGAWVLCHARFDRPASERFTGYTACPATFNVDGERDDDGVGFVRNVIVSGGDCESAYPAVSAWIASASGWQDDAVTLADGTTCTMTEDDSGENPAVEGICHTPAGLTVAMWAAP